MSWAVFARSRHVGAALVFSLYVATAPATAQPQHGDVVAGSVIGRGGLAVASMNRVIRWAASFSNQRGVRVGGGHSLALDPRDPLFIASASDGLPAVFRGFRGVLDSQGRATARVELPRGLPSSEVTVFVGGVVFDHRGRFVTATNTHWFELP